MYYTSNSKSSTDSTNKLRYHHIVLYLENTAAIIPKLIIEHVESFAQSINVFDVFAFPVCMFSSIYISDSINTNPSSLSYLKSIKYQRGSQILDNIHLNSNRIEIWATKTFHTHLWNKPNSITSHGECTQLGKQQFPTRRHAKEKPGFSAACFWSVFLHGTAFGIPGHPGKSESRTLSLDGIVPAADGVNFRRKIPSFPPPAAGVLFIIRWKRTRGLFCVAAPALFWPNK